MCKCCTGGNKKKKKTFFPCEVTGYLGRKADLSNKHDMNSLSNKIVIHDIILIIIKNYKKFHLNTVESLSPYILSVAQLFYHKQINK